MRRRITPPRSDLGSNCGKALSSTLDMGGRFIVMDADSVAVLDAGATTNLVCFQLTGHRNNISET